MIPGIFETSSLTSIAGYCMMKGELRKLSFNARVIGRIVHSNAGTLSLHVKRNRTKIAKYAILVLAFSKAMLAFAPAYGVYNTPNSIWLKLIYLNFAGA